VVSTTNHEPHESELVQPAKDIEDNACHHYLRWLLYG
jgi:hypothetical protein